MRSFSIYLLRTSYKALLLLQICVFIRFVRTMPSTGRVIIQTSSWTSQTPGASCGVGALATYYLATYLLPLPYFHHDCATVLLLSAPASSLFAFQNFSGSSLCSFQQLKYRKCLPYPDRFLLKVPAEILFFSGAKVSVTQREAKKLSVTLSPSFSIIKVVERNFKRGKNVDRSFVHGLTVFHHLDFYMSREDKRRDIKRKTIKDSNINHKWVSGSL